MKKIMSLCLLAIISISCDKQPVSQIPYCQVYLDLDLYSQDQILQVGNSGGYKVFTSKRNAIDKLGYGGIIVYREPYGNNLWAFDLACPNEASSDIRIVPDGSPTTITATCPKCKAVYDLAAGGAPQSGSEYYLRKYQIVSIDNQYKYRVVN